MTEKFFNVMLVGEVLRFLYFEQFKLVINHRGEDEVKVVFNDPNEQSQDFLRWLDFWVKKVQLEHAWKKNSINSFASE